MPDPVGPMERIIKWHDDVLKERAKDRDHAWREATPWAIVQWGGYSMRFEDDEFRELIAAMRALAVKEGVLEACRDWFAACPPNAGPEDFRTEWMTASEMLAFVREALAAAADIQDDKGEQP